MAATNPGGAMAAAIDKEVARFKEIQGQLQKVRSDFQIVLGQLTENEMVQHELDLLDGSSNIYKMVGPVLIKNSLEETKETVSKRIEFISAEKKRLESKGQELERQGNEISDKVQQMQSSLQQATAAAVNEVAKQHAGS
jgi:prefoldin beta subunit